MSVRRGLGRGLSALLGDDVAAAGLRHIAVDRITPNPHQPRTSFDRQAQEELQRSIREFGVLVPIIVRERDGGDRYELIAGERRWRAAVALALPTIPALVRTADDRESLELAVVENLQRENLDPLEEAMGYASLIDEFGFTQEHLAERVGKSRPAVANALRLLELPDAIKRHIHSRAISAGHARALLALPEQQRAAVAERIVKEGLSVRVVERLAAPKRKRTATAKRAASDVEDVESRLRYRLGTQAKIVRRGRGGHIEIRFVDDADLIRVVDVILAE
jgi:ParB family chromosome partitioning protein